MAGGMRRVRGTLSQLIAHSPSDQNYWKPPEALTPLRDWLSAHSVDVCALKTPRQALYIAIKLSKLDVRMPKRGGEFVALMTLQYRLTGVRYVTPNPAARAKREGKRGTFGAASEVRSVDPSTVQLGKKLH